MADDIDIAIRLNPAEARALLRFLRMTGTVEIVRVLGPESAVSLSAFDSASEKVRIALRDKIEPNWREEMLRDLADRKKK